MMSTTIAERVRSLRERMGMTGQEVADIGGLPNASQVSKVENGHNLATTLHIRAGLAKGFGLTLIEFNDYLDGKLNIEQAYKLGWPRLGPKLKELRERQSMSRQDELEEAIRRARVPDDVVIWARSMAAGGKQQTVDQWVHTLHHINTLFQRVLAGKVNNG